MFPLILLNIFVWLYFWFVVAALKVECVWYGQEGLDRLWYEWLSTSIDVESNRCWRFLNSAEREVKEGLEGWRGGGTLRSRKLKNIGINWNIFYAYLMRSHSGQVSIIYVGAKYMKAAGLHLVIWLSSLNLSLIALKVTYWLLIWYRKEIKDCSIFFAICNKTLAKQKYRLVWAC